MKTLILITLLLTSLIVKSEEPTYQDHLKALNSTGFIPLSSFLYDNEKTFRTTFVKTGSMVWISYEVDIETKEVLQVDRGQNFKLNLNALRNQK